MDWESLVEEHLLKSSDKLSGIALVSRHGHVISCREELAANIPESYWNQFQLLFTKRHTPEVGRLVLPADDCDEDDVFIVHTRTETSVYATTKGNFRGLVACLLPHGVLVCSYHAPQSPHTVADLVERFCEILRS
ncbi:uncharacterized protein LOC134180072 [Corticium candelabrum]|uniref:uncharacterized protein LOC134180072 n=1 Tax=Corticium candelabrum TaxID=121492 RepID=UPI002E25A4F7|nr:uncharacterized protein LOC134180072 [Corticium candelabrum]